MTNINCEAQKDRKKLTEDMYRAVHAGNTPDPNGFDGSEAQLMQEWAYLKGIVAEYIDGGDQMAELCTCPRPTEHHIGTDIDPDEQEGLRHRNGNEGQDFAHVEEKYRA